MPRYALGSSSDISDPLIYANAPYNAAIARNTPPFYVVPLTSINFPFIEHTYEKGSNTVTRAALNLAATLIAVTDGKT